MGPGTRRDERKGSVPLFRGQLCQHADIFQTVERGNRLAQLAGTGGADDRRGERVEFLSKASSLVGDVGIGDASVERRAGFMPIRQLDLDFGARFLEIFAEIEAHPLAQRD
jgi:hypothetical protein